MKNETLDRAQKSCVKNASRLGVVVGGLPGRVRSVGRRPAATAQTRRQPSAWTAQNPCTTKRCPIRTQIQPKHKPKPEPRPSLYVLAHTGAPRVAAALHARSGIWTGSAPARGSCFRSTGRLLVLVVNGRMRELGACERPRIMSFHLTGGAGDGPAAADGQHAHRILDLTFRVADFDLQVEPGTGLPRQTGNMYTASLWSGLASLISDQGSELEACQVS